MGEFDSDSSPDEKNIRMWAMAMHLSQLGNFIVPISGIVAPIVIWQIQKEAMPELEVHGRNIVNWMISLVIYFSIAAVLCLVMIGFPLLMVLGALMVVFPIIGGLKASEGKVWKYPGTIEFLK